ncbi:hypothetical protein HK104_006374 [Borealophlyctis nickersoniae]|nr:hypothetical protein HK104_006374 [Borealophlyctis nickersoniae]
MSHRRSHQRDQYDDDDDATESAGWRSRGPKGDRRSAAEESLVVMGTEQPLDPLDVRARDRNKYLPVHLQEVRDEKGRKRLHGAFTGGFSAGYFNTVGSKEGWQPSQFVSSRAARGAKPDARPEDFMDDEDLMELKGAKQVAPTDDFDVLGGTERELARRRAVTNKMAEENSAALPLPGRVIDDLVGPAKDPVGTKLLRQMGWREGHGVGPRAKRKRRSDEEDDMHAAEHLFAPKDTTVVRVMAKTDVYGIGYNPFRNAPEFATRKDGWGAEEHEGGGNISSGQRGQKEPRKQTGNGGFGLGIFEDDDDEDVYASNAVTFDTIIDDDEDSFIPARFRKPQSQIPKSGSLKPLPKTAIANTSTQRGSMRLCHDGRPPLPGFTLAITPIIEAKRQVFVRLDVYPYALVTLRSRYPPPEVPADFVAVHAFKDDAPNRSQPAGHQSSQLTADQRRDILGEEALKGPARSVFAFVPLKEQGRLQQFIEHATKSRAAKADSGQKETERIPQVGKEAALAALKGFMPFGNDLEKQRRYRSYLEVQAGLATTYITRPGASEYDVNHEMLEFSKAAMLYRPMSSMMASRFTSATEMPSEKSGLTSANDTKEQAVTAAQMNMYGALTRTFVTWHPAKLLCKRFGVPDPHASEKTKAGSQGLREEDRGNDRDVLNPRAMNELMMERDRLVAEGKLIGDGMVLGGATQQTKEKLSREPGGSQMEEPSAVDQEETYERPPMDIFRAIFADSDEEEDSEEEEDALKQPVPSSTPPNETNQLPVPPPSTTTGDTPASVPLPPPTFRPLFRRKEDRGKAVASNEKQGSGVAPPPTTSRDESIATRPVEGSRTQEAQGEPAKVEVKSSGTVEHTQRLLPPPPSSPALPPSEPGAAGRKPRPVRSNQGDSSSSHSSSSSDEDSDLHATKRIKRRREEVDEDSMDSGGAKKRSRKDKKKTKRKEKKDRKEKKKKKKEKERAGGREGTGAKRKRESPDLEKESNRRSRSGASSVSRDTAEDAARVGGRVEDRRVRVRPSAADFM